jgi:hypothetical protein
MARMKEMAMDIAEKRDIEMHEVTDEMVGEELTYRAVTALAAEDTSDADRKRWTEYLKRTEQC